MLVEKCEKLSARQLKTTIQTTKNHPRAFLLLCLGVFFCFFCSCLLFLFFGFLVEWSVMGWKRRRKEESHQTRKPRLRTKNKLQHKKTTKKYKNKKTPQGVAEKMQILDHNLKAYKTLIKSFKKANRA